MSISEKLQTIADNQQAVYNAGYVAGQVSEGVSVADQSYNPLSVLAQSGKAVAEAIAPLEEQLPFVPSYKKLYDTVTITQEDIEAAGEEGITCITIGNKDIDLTPYSDILIRFYLPGSSALNSQTGMLCVGATTEPNDSITADYNKLLHTQSTSISTACSMYFDKPNNWVIKGVFDKGNFLYGEVIKNGYGNSWGYSGAQNGWTSISNNFNLAQRKYFHIFSHPAVIFKFPVGTYAEVWGR